MNRSFIADEIMREYRKKQHYEKLKRQKCKEKECDECDYKEVCTENDIIE